MVVGTTNRFGTPTGSSGAWKSFAAVIGENNRLSARSSLIVGLANTATPTATDVADSVQYSGIFGNANTANLVDSSLMVGFSNTIGAASPSTQRTANSATIGILNGVFSNIGWAMGYSNEVNATRGVAIGTCTKVTTTDCTALGRYNAPTGSNDVLVVGNGNYITPSTALTITSDGGVILGRAQGDVSMGAYAN